MDLKVEAFFQRYQLINDERIENFNIMLKIKPTFYLHGSIDRSIISIIRFIIDTDSHHYFNGNISNVPNSKIIW